MTLVWLIGILICAGVAAAIAARWSSRAPRWIAIAALSADLLLTLAMIVRATPAGWMAEVDWPWLPILGIRFHLAADGLSALLLLLTFVLGLVSVLASWTEIRSSIGFFHLNLLWILAGIAGVFAARDLFLFYFAWELMLVPMYFLIAIWGHERRNYAAVKFFLFTQLSGLLMLAAILSLYLFHHAATGEYSFDYSRLIGTPLSARAETWIMLGFAAAFAVKLPAVPFHSWLPDAHSEASTAGSVILAGLMLKTGAYGFLRFVLPLFPEAVRQFTPLAMVLASVGIVYGALMAFAQTDLKRLIAYTSVSHMGFVLLGIFSANALALQGVVITILAHGFSTGALFFIAGGLQERMHTREMPRMGGLWTVAPRLSGTALFFALASLGLPGLGDFVGEVLVLLGAYRVSPGAVIAAAIGIFTATLYALRMIQRVFHGENVNHWRIPDFSIREGAVAGAMMAVLLWLGLYPKPVFRMFQPAMDSLERSAQTARLK